MPYLQACETHLASMDVADRQLREANYLKGFWDSFSFLTSQQENIMQLFERFTTEEFVSSDGTIPATAEQLIYTATQYQQDKDADYRGESIAEKQNATRSAMEHIAAFAEAFRAFMAEAITYVSTELRQKFAASYNYLRDFLSNLTSGGMLATASSWVSNWILLFFEQAFNLAKRIFIPLYTRVADAVRWIGTIASTTFYTVLQSASNVLRDKAEALVLLAVNMLQQHITELPSKGVEEERAYLASHAAFLYEKIINLMTRDFADIKWSALQDYYNGAILAHQTSEKLVKSFYSLEALAMRVLSFLKGVLSAGLSYVTDFIRTFVTGPAMVVVLRYLEQTNRTAGFAHDNENSFEFQLNDVTNYLEQNFDAKHKGRILIETKIAKLRDMLPDVDAALTDLATSMTPRDLPELHAKLIETTAAVNGTGELPYHAGLDIYKKAIENRPRLKEFLRLFVETQFNLGGLEVDRRDDAFVLQPLPTEPRTEQRIAGKDDYYDYFDSDYDSGEDSDWVPSKKTRSGKRSRIERSSSAAKAIMDQPERATLSLEDLPEMMASWGRLIGNTAITAKRNFVALRSNPLFWGLGMVVAAYSSYYALAAGTFAGQALAASETSRVCARQLQFDAAVAIDVTQTVGDSKTLLNMAAKHPELNVLLPKYMRDQSLPLDTEEQRGKLTLQKFEDMAWWSWTEEYSLSDWFRDLFDSGEDYTSFLHLVDPVEYAEGDADTREGMDVFAHFLESKREESHRLGETPDRRILLLREGAFAYTTLAKLQEREYLISDYLADFMNPKILDAEYLGARIGLLPDPLKVVGRSARLAAVIAFNAGKDYWWHSAIQSTSKTLEHFYRSHWLGEEIEEEALATTETIKAWLSGGWIGSIYGFGSALVASLPAVPVMTFFAFYAYEVYMNVQSTSDLVKSTFKVGGIAVAVAAAAVYLNIITTENALYQATVLAQLSAALLSPKTLQLFLAKIFTKSDDATVAATKSTLGSLLTRIAGEKVKALESPLLEEMEQRIRDAKTEAEMLEMRNQMRRMELELERVRGREQHEFTASLERECDTESESASPPMKFLVSPQTKQAARRATDELVNYEVDPAKFDRLTDAEKLFIETELGSFASGFQ